MAIMHSLYREAGSVRIDPGICTQCGACAQICPSAVLVMDNGKICVHDDSPFGCIACGHCMMVCPVAAVSVNGRGVSPDDVTPLPAPEKRADAEQLSNLMLSRRSVRQFTDQEVDEKLLERIVGMASMAPMGIPPWDVGCVMVCGRPAIRQIAAKVIRGYEGFLTLFKPWVLALMRPFVGKEKYEMFANFLRPLAQAYVQSSQAGQDKLFYDAPALLIFHHSAYADAVDASIACTYAMLAAESMGLGSTIIGGAPPIIQRNKALRKRLGIPTGNTPAIALIIGYPTTQFRFAIHRHFSHVSMVGG